MRLSPLSSGKKAKAVEPSGYARYSKINKPERGTKVVPRESSSLYGNNAIQRRVFFINFINYRSPSRFNRQYAT